MEILGKNINSLKMKIDYKILATSILTTSMFIGVLLLTDDTTTEADDTPFEINIKVKCTEVILNSNYFTQEQVNICKNKINNI